MRLLLLTCAGQTGNDGMSDAVKREIEQILQERRIVSRAAVSTFDMSKAAPAENGITIGAKAKYFEFETCKEIYVGWEPVRLLA